MLLQYYLGLSAYLILGGLVLHTVEKPHEAKEMERGRDIVRLANLTDDQVHILKESRMCRFNIDDDDKEWTLSGATFFSLTVVTTIGYGFIAPVSDFGRTFTLFYSIIGIGLVAHILQKCTTIVTKAVRKFWVCFTRRPGDPPEEMREMGGGLTDLGKDKALLTFDRFDADHSGTIDMEELGLFLETLSNEPVDPLVTEYVMHCADTDPDGVLTREEMVHAVTIFYALKLELPETISWKALAGGAMLMFLWLIIWAAAFAYQEAWSWRDGFWYCYVTLTTIGFGDYHPRSNVGRFMAFLFVIPGLSIVSWFIQVVFQTSQAKRYWMLQKAYSNGKVSEKVLRAQGIRPLHVTPAQIARKSSGSSGQSPALVDGPPPPPPAATATQSVPASSLPTTSLQPFRLDDVDTAYASTTLLPVMRNNSGANSGAAAALSPLEYSPQTTPVPSPHTASLEPPAILPHSTSVGSLGVLGQQHSQQQRQRVDSRATPGRLSRGRGSLVGLQLPTASAHAPDSAGGGGGGAAPVSPPRRPSYMQSATPPPSSMYTADNPHPAAGVPSFLPMAPAPPQMHRTTNSVTV